MAAEEHVASGFGTRTLFCAVAALPRGSEGGCSAKDFGAGSKILDEGLERTAAARQLQLKREAKSVGLVGSADPEAVEKQRKVTEKLRRIRFSRADALARLLA